MKKLKKHEILIAISDAVFANPEFVVEIFGALLNGLKNRNIEQNQKLVNKDKALLVLWGKDKCGSDKNLEDTAKELTENCFNGTKRVYTVEDIKKFIEK